MVGVEVVCCGQCHTLVLLRTGDVVGWGDNSYGQLGLPVRVRTRRR